MRTDFELMSFLWIGFLKGVFGIGCNHRDGIINVIPPENAAAGQSSRQNY